MINSAETDRMILATKSLRDYLLDNLVLFSTSSEISGLVTPATLTGLVVSLAELREEGVLLTPEIYICESIKDALMLLPVKAIIQIGKQSDPEKAIREAVKRCGPLAIEGWCVYIAEEGMEYQYGLFRGSLNPSSISTERMLFSEPRDTVKLVRVFRIALGCVELKNHKGDVCNLLLNDKPAFMPLPHSIVSDLVRHICTKVKEPFRSSTITYVEKTIRAALKACHGTIIVVTKNNKIPVILSDGVHLNARLDIATAVSKHLTETHDTQAEHALNATAALVKGMVSSDGITIFNSAGSLIAYNCFVTSRTAKLGRPTLGGARTRAFEALKSNVGKSISCVFIQSQDGWTQFLE